jgi:L-fuculose-phosphate aldolase
MSAAGDRSALADAIVRACRRLDALGLVAGIDGNVSARLDAESVLVTPSGVPKHQVTADALVVVDAETGAPRSAAGRPSSELAMHLAIYAARADVGAVVHAHPPCATGLATAGRAIPADVLPEIILLMGSVPLVPYGEPGTGALPAAMHDLVPHHDALLLANHGATTMGSGVQQALVRMESLEHAARILLAAEVAGGARPLPPGAAAALHARRHPQPTPSS